MIKKQKFKFIKLKEIIALIIFIIVASFSIIEVKNLLKHEKIKNLTEPIEINSDGTQEKPSIIASLFEPEKEDTPLRVAGNAIAVLDIPSRSIRGQIVEGTDDETLKDYIGMFESSAEPGEIGNLTLAAHRNIYTEIFRDLDKVQKGDKIRIVTKTHEYVYTVTEVFEVYPEQIEVLEGGTKREITLITCTPTAAKRVVVKGELTDTIELEN